MTTLLADELTNTDLHMNAANCADDISLILAEGTAIAKYCIGYHIRNALDRAAPTIAVVSTDDALHRQILEENNRRGLHLLNHVLDSLYYPSSDSDEVNNAVSIFVRLTFDMQEEESCHHFDEVVDNEEVAADRGFRVWSALPSPDAERSLLGNWWNGFDVLHTRMGILHDSELVDLQDVVDPSDVFDRMFGANREFYNQYVCGAQKLCSQMRIAPSLVAYRSIMAAIYQLRQYALPTRFGQQTVTMMLRPPEPFGYVVGLTVISSEVIDKDPLQKLGTTILKHYRSLRRGRSIAGSRSASLPTESFQPFRYGSKLQAIPEIGLCSPLEATLNRYGIGAARLTDEGHIADTIRSFLRLAMEFCDEQLEGRQLSFGIVLGNAGLMRYWPGSLPREMRSNSRGGYVAIKDLPKEVHLLEDSETQCLVVPYLVDKLQKDSPLPCSVLELDDFEEALSAWPEGILWIRALRPYAYLTQRFPWALAVVVGPGSQMRVFAGGRLQAYRDGKGWRKYTDPVVRLERDLPGWFGADASGDELKELVRSAVATSIQMSSLTHRDAHGGLLLYAPVDHSKAGTEDQEAIDWLGKHVKTLHDFEPLGDGDAQRWLKGRSLLRRRTDVDGQVADCVEFDRSVARLIMRAAALDGAFILTRPLGRIWRFGQRINVSSEIDLEDERGTKRQTAASFVIEMATICKKRDAFAIVVSSDGSVRLYVYNEHLSTRYQRFDAFEDLPDA